MYKRPNGIQKPLGLVEKDGDTAIGYQDLTKVGTSVVWDFASVANVTIVL
jgi:hypothetical protein